MQSSSQETNHNNNTGNVTATNIRVFGTLTCEKQKISTPHQTKSTNGIVWV